MKFTIEPYSVPAKLVTKRHLWPVKEDAQDCVGTVQEYNGVLHIGVFDGQLSTLVHELYHTVLIVQKYVGLDPFSSNGEAGAYLIDCLYTKCARVVLAQQVTGPKI